MAHSLPVSCPVPRGGCHHLSPGLFIYISPLGSPRLRVAGSAFNLWQQSCCFVNKKEIFFFYLTNKVPQVSNCGAEAASLALCRNPSFLELAPKRCVTWGPGASCSPASLCSLSDSVFHSQSGKSIHKGKKINLCETL